MADRSADRVVQLLLQHADEDFRAASGSGLPGMNERDVLLLDASRGVLVVLEVKDWSEPALRETPKSQKTWDVDGKAVKAPLLQAWDALKALLERLPPDCRPKRDGGCATFDFTWLYGLVFPNLTAGEAQTLGLFDDDRLLPPGFPYLWKEDLAGNALAALRRTIDAALRTKEWKPGRMPKKFRDKFWARISPDVDAAPRAEHRRLQTKGDRSALDEDFASKLLPQHGPHRVNGVVGSGKTLYIAYKALEKAAEAANRKKGGRPLPFGLNRDVLVVCKTRSGASKLRHDIAAVATSSYPTGFHWEDYVEVYYQYEFLRKYYIVRVVGDPGENYSDFCAKQQALVKYEAILIDEYQDFEPNWGGFMARHVRDPQESLFLVTFDPAQGHHLLKLAPRFDEIIDVLLPGQQAYDWKSRNYYLGTCYRVPRRIGEFAAKVHVRLTKQNFHDAGGASAEKLAAVIDRAMRPHFASAGGTVRLRKAAVSSPEDEALAICECIEELCAQTDATLGDIVLAVPPKPFNPDEGQYLAECLESLEVDTFLLLNNLRDKFFQRGERLVIGTPMRLKGLEIPIVILAPSLIGYLQTPHTRKDAFYQAATRATSHLAVLGDGELFDEIAHIQSDFSALPG